jgi:hypothetical protein
MKNLKVKALALLAGWMAAVFGGVAVVQLLAHQFGSEVIMNLITGGFIVGLLYMVYNLILTKLEWDSKIDDLNQK